MIIRKHYRAYIANENSAWQQALEADKEVVKAAVADGKCMMVALYRHNNMLFVYMEALEEKLEAEVLFPTLSMYLAPWPKMDGFSTWAKMYHIYYHALPDEVRFMEGRKEKKVRRGRIARLYEDKLFSYVYYHKAIVDEGLLEGDMYQSIALQDDILFSYFEEPKILTHVKEDIKEESKVIEDWLAVDPESHFDHEFTGGGNFVFIEELFSVGKEDL